MATNHTRMMELIEGGEKLVFLSTIDQLLLYNANNALQIRPLRERLFLVNISLFARKQSCLIEYFNTQMERFFDSGMLAKWQRQYIQIDKKGSDMVNNVKEQFSVAQLLFAFQVLAVLYFVAGIVIVLEIFTRKIVLLKKIIDFCTY